MMVYRKDYTYESTRNKEKVEQRIAELIARKDELTDTLIKRNISGFDTKWITIELDDIKDRLAGLGYCD